MIPAKLITGGNEAKRMKLAQEIIQKNGFDLLKLHPDLLILKAENSIGISQIRELKKWLILKPYCADNKIAIILQAEMLTLPAQNALLKTLEEPTKNSLIILISPNAQLLLATIISRCQLIRLAQENEIQINQTQQEKILNSILKSRVGERLKISLEYSQNRQQAIDFIKGQLWVWRQLLLQNPSLAIASNLYSLQKTYQLLKANINPGLALGNLLISLK